MSAERYSVSFIRNALIEGATTYTIKVTDPEGRTWNIQKRYREIRDLDDELRRAGAVVPQIPGKKFFGNSDPVFIAQRQIGLQQYLQGVLQGDPQLTMAPLRAFLQAGVLPSQPGERSQARQGEEILENMNTKLLNLSMPPAPLDENEVTQRVRRYGQVMRNYVFSQPVDPVHQRAAGLDSDPAPLAPGNADELEALKKAAPRFKDDQMLAGLLAALQPAVRPNEPIATSDELIAPFPEAPIGPPPGAAAAPGGAGQRG